MPTSGVWSPCWTETGAWLRFAVRTRWLVADDDLAAVLDGATAGLRGDVDTIAVSEKVAVLLTHRAIPSETIVPGRLARALARHVRTVGNSRGLSVPEKMQLVLERQGRIRVVIAAVTAALLRPLGRHGSFYRLAGDFARDLDGMRPPYLDVLLPPLTHKEARQLAEHLQQQLGAGVAVVDINDRGGSVRAVSSHALPESELLTVLGDNPLGQGRQSTPFVLVRRLPAGQEPAEDGAQLDQFPAAHQQQRSHVDHHAAQGTGQDGEQSVPGAGEQPCGSRRAGRGDGHLSAAATHACQ